MKRTYVHDLYSSFVLYFDHTLLTKGDAYTNVNSLLYPINDDRLKSFSVFGSPFKEWVYDSSVSGAQIPSGVYSNDVFIPRGQSGLQLDFNNGRVIFSGGTNVSPVSGQFSAKEFNIFTTTKSDQELIFEQRIDFASQFPQSPSGIPGDKVVAPAIFIRFGSMTSDPFSLGGEYNTKVPARAIILSDSNYALDGVGNIFVDQKEKNFLVFSQTPLNEFGDLKTGYYNYFDYLNEFYDSRKLAYLEEVDFVKPNIPKESLNPDLRIGFVDFTLSLPRLV